MAKFSTPRGTQDILPDDWPYWTFVVRQAEDIARLFGYQRIETPNFAETQLFSRTSGQGSDVVEKEMYNFLDRDGNGLTLRPEGTAPVMRAYLQHGMHKLPQPVKLYYIERMYRYSAPQRGRYREHHQFGCEAIGLEDAYLDVELIALLHEWHGRMGLQDLELHINSIGDQHCRPAYVQALVKYLREREGSLSKQDRDRIERNPLRVLDSKDTASQAALRDAPRTLDYLCDACREHWGKLLHGLDLVGIAYELDHRLVRGLDYYTRTVWECMPPGDGAQSTVDAGGRYDALSEAMGGPPIPGVGFGAGLERVILNLKDRNICVDGKQSPTVYVAHRGPGAADAALLLVMRLRKANVSADMAFGARNLGTQMKHADTLGAKFVAIIGEEELAAHRVTLRNLESGEQQSMSPDEMIRALD
jgi:histidyl-tRNA synthetase